MKLPIRVYLANPYSSKLKDKDAASLQRAHRRALESYVGGTLKKKYKGKYAFLLQISLSGSMADLCSFDTGFAEWASDDYAWIDACEETWVLMSDGWKDSIGVQAEIKFALKNKKKVRFIDPTTLNFVKEQEFIN
jgi:pyruvate/2-oxoacid:ferredoxin oxidoreductase beta subunit